MYVQRCIMDTLFSGDEPYDGGGGVKVAPMDFFAFDAAQGNKVWWAGGVYLSLADLSLAHVASPTYAGPALLPPPRTRMAQATHGSNPRPPPPLNAPPSTLPSPGPFLLPCFLACVLPCWPYVGLLRSAALHPAGPDGRRQALRR